jgi:hypothetical protein
MQWVISAVVLLFSSIVYSSDGSGPGPSGGHGTMRLGVDAGLHQTLGAVVGIQYRFGLHDLLDRQNEYPDHTQLDIFSVRVETLPSQNSVALDQATFLGILRLPPMTKKWEELSWKVEVGARTVREALCNRCGAVNLGGGLGVTVEPWERIPLGVWALLETEFLASPSFAGFFIKPSLGPRLGARWRVTPWLNGWAFASYRVQWAAVSSVLSFGTEWRVALGREWALNAKFQWFNDGYQATAGLFTYF